MREFSSQFLDNQLEIYCTAVLQNLAKNWLVIKPGTERNEMERNETKRNEMKKIVKSVDSGVVR